MSPRLDCASLSPFFWPTQRVLYSTAAPFWTLGLDSLHTKGAREGLRSSNCEHGQGEGRGAFGEPPFDALPALRDPQALARQPQHWFIAQGWRAPGAKPLPLPRRLEPGKSALFILDLAPPPDAANKQARLRIQFEQAPGEGQWRASINGETLVGTTDVSEPFPVPYPCMLGKPDELRAWLVPVKLLRDGSNRIGLELRSGAPATVTFLDLAVH